MKKLIQIALIVLIIFSLNGCSQKQEKVIFNIYSLTGPTSMGLVKLYNDDQEQNYISHIVSDASEISSALINENADVAMLPANLASVLYNKTSNFKVVAINTLGVLYIVENGNSINSLNDLRGKSIILTGQGTTPEYVLRYLLKEIGTENEVNLIFKSSASEVATTLASGLADIALLPQPFVTVALNKNSNLRVALDLNEQYSNITNGLQLITAVTVIRNDILENNPKAVNAFLKKYQDSINWVNENNCEAAQMIVDLAILNDVTIAEKALPYCNLVFIDKQEMKSLLESYLTILYNSDPTSIGNKLPDENFYYIND